MSLPVGWERKKLSDFILLQRGFDLPNKKRRPGNYKVISAGDVHGWHNEYRVSGPGFTIGRVTNIGRPTWSEEDFWPLNTTLYAKDLLGNDVKFAYYWFLGTDLSGYNSGSVQPTLNRNYIVNVPIDVPPVIEQQAIAATLGALDDKIESNRRIARLAEEIILAYFEKYFDISGQENGIAISNLIAVNPKYRLKKGVEAIKISMADLPENSAIISTWNKEIVAGGQRFTNGDVLFARITPCLENGKTSIVDMLDDDSVGFGSTEFIVLSPKGNIKTAWIYAFARNKSVRTWAARNMTGTSGRQRFQASFFDGYLISPPSEKMIENFNLIANPFTQKLTQIRDENLKLESLRDALLPELMSGRICVPEAQEAIAEVIPEEDDEHASKTSRG